MPFVFRLQLLLHHRFKCGFPDCRCRFGTSRRRINGTQEMGTVSRRFEHINSSARRAPRLPATAAASGKHRFAVGYTNVGGTEERNRCVYILIKSGSDYLKLGRRRRPHQQRLATHNCRAICLTLSMLCTGGALPTCALLHNYESNHLLPVALLLLLLMIIIVITSQQPALHTNAGEKRMVSR